MFYEYHVKRATQGTINQLGQKGQVTPFLRFCKLSRDIMFEEGGRRVLVWLGGRVEVFIGCWSNICLLRIRAKRECNTVV